MADIRDFGEKIGGARKDDWKHRGIHADDFETMNDMERKTHIKKDNIWLKPDWAKIVSGGTPQGVAYWQNKMRQAIPPHPPKDDEWHQKCYVDVVCKIRDAVMAVTTPSEVDSFYARFLQPEFIAPSSSRYYVNVKPEADGVINNKVLRASQSRYSRMRQEAEKKLFGISKDEQTYVAMKQSLAVYCYDGENVTIGPDAREPDDTVLTIHTTLGRSFFYMREGNPFRDAAQWEHGTYFVLNEKSRKPVQINFPDRKAAEDFIESHARAAQETVNKSSTEKGNKKGTKKKGAFVPPQLRSVQRTGPDYRDGFHANGNLFLKSLHFRGGEFGNWLNDQDRQTSLDMAYDGLRDLARVLQIRPEDVSFGGDLAIAFGARGRGGANAGAAHYEPDRKVINLTKMSGAGCLAHEWGHALDHAIGSSCGIVGFASESNSPSVPESFKDIISSMKYKKGIVQPEEQQSELADKIAHAKRNLSNWIDSVKPRKMDAESEKAWNDTKSTILSCTSEFTGAEYMQTGKKNVVAKPEIEFLSQLTKMHTNRSVPRDTKRQIVLWSVELKRFEEQARACKPVERMVKTDYYKGSIQFDKEFSRSAHGYWQSDVEMFARAFDCYIADKLREEGVRSDYLSAHADSFSRMDENGEVIAAFPRGEERTLLNEKFDLLMAEVKERGILQDHIEEHTPPVPASPGMSRSAVADTPFPTHAEQLSFDDILFSAQQRADDATKAQQPISPDRIR